VRALQDQRDRITRLLGGVSEARSAFRYADGKWSIKQVVGHMADSERVFAYRLLRIARGDQTPLPGFDQNLFMTHAHFDSRTLASLVEDWSLVRASTISLVQSLDAGDWLRRGTTSQASVTVRGVLYVALGHVEHHHGVLVDAYGLA
jgi:uncharacterized damage-inducible protein DinB